jgi:hypothetical protein
MLDPDPDSNESGSETLPDRNTNPLEAVTNFDKMRFLNQNPVPKLHENAGSGSVYM